MPDLRPCAENDVSVRKSEDEAATAAPPAGSSLNGGRLEITERRGSDGDEGRS